MKMHRTLSRILADNYIQLEIENKVSVPEVLSGRKLRTRHPKTILLFLQFRKLHNSGKVTDANTIISGIAYRKLYDISSKNTSRSSIYTIPYNGKTYLFIDYHAETNDTIVLPKEYSDKTFSIIEKSNNVKVLNSSINNKILIEVSTAEPQYGYIILELK